MYIRKQGGLPTRFFFPCWEYDNVIKIRSSYAYTFLPCNYTCTFVAEAKAGHVVLEMESYCTCYLSTAGGQGGDSYQGGRHLNSFCRITELQVSRDLNSGSD